MKGKGFPIFSHCMQAEGHLHVDKPTCVCWDYVSRNARSVEESSSPGVVRVDFHAGLKELPRWSPW